MKTARTLSLPGALLLTLLTLAPAAGQGPESRAPTPATGDGVPTPTEYLGYPVGADFHLADWDTITRYLAALAEASPFVSVDTLGSTTLERPLITVTATAPANMRRLAEIRAAQARLADPRRLAEGELEALLETQPAVILVANNIHATEIASSQGAMELAYELATDPGFRALLEEAVVLLIPSVNPDGQALVVDWYRRTLGTPYEGSAMPWLYHHYTGHDNNRDWFMLTQVETRLVTDLLYRDWFPEIVYDVHQMGNRGARFFVPPFDDPLNPNLDPLLVRMISLFGLAISTELEATGMAGVVNRQTYDLWWHGGNRTVPARHNMVGILSEAASARLASPIFQELERLEQPPLGVNYPNPWPGGWWRMRDIIDYQRTATRAILRLAVARRRSLIRNYVELGRRAIAAGHDEPPFAYVIPSRQRDPGSATAMLEVLRRGGVEVARAEASFTADGLGYPAGSWVVPMAQPYRAHAKDLLERQDYPDRRLWEGGPPDRPYDVAGWTLPLQMGVEAVPVSAPFDARLTPERSTIRPPRGRLVGSGPHFATDHTMNAAHRAIHATLARGGQAILLAEALATADRTWPVGSVVLVGDGLSELLRPLARSEGISFHTVSGSARGYRVAAPRIGLYRSWTAPIDEGWTRWVFDTWDVPYRTLHDAEIRAGGLNDRLDVIILPDMSARAITEGREAGTVPAEFTGGLGATGAAALRRFVETGGTLICLGSASDFAIEHLGLPVRNVRPVTEQQRSGAAFYAPGSILRASFRTDHPIAYGMPEEGAIYYANDPVFQLGDGASERVTIVARYPETGQLLSGYALHPDFLADKAALVDVRVEAGRAILFGFRPQHRGQPHETFKLLFNALYLGAADGPRPVDF